VSEEIQELAEQVAHAARAAGWTVATAESLTSGRVATELGKAPEAAEWFRGAVVAYGSEVKFGALGVPEGPVITRTAALEMARGASRLLGADLVVSLTGAGGPGPEEGQQAGTVWFGCVWPGGEHSACEVFDGDPSAVVEASTRYALETLVRALERSAATADRAG
jgi:nicotinamide-nucleotide amidase